MDAKLIVTSRDLTGSPNARRMRRAGFIPGVIYSDGGKAREVSLPKHAFEQMLHHHAGEQMMLTIELDGKEVSVLLKEVQHDVMTGGTEHVDLQEVAMNKKLRVSIAVELVGDASGVKNQGGVLDHLLHHVEIECLPGDILEKIEVDVSDLKLGDMLTAKDIPLDASKYEMVTAGDVGVASVSAPRVGEALEEGAEEATAPEVINEKNAEEAE
ncbi:MAG: 50S ribosomal protein L25 [Verrucomicrobia bacterium]|nr:50S ribosomal protein L25 [Verrucomicrobiota bacterium]